MSNTILLVEDEVVHYQLFKRNLDRSKIEAELMWADTGTQAINLLQDYSLPQPSIVVLDLNLPDMSGIKVLQHIREKSQLSLLKVIVLSTSNIFEEYDVCVKLGISAYIEKPVSYASLFEQLHSMM